MRHLLILFAALGCAPETPAKAPPPEEQSYATAIRTFCEADRNSGADPEDPLEVSAKREEYLLGHVKNSDGIYLLTLFRTAGPAEQANMLEKEAAGQKLGDCPLVAALRAEAAG
jgi:hypothetical protein